MQPTKYEMFRNNDGFYYQTHCHCGTTMSTGEYLASMSIAYLTCLESMDQHQARCTKAAPDLDRNRIPGESRDVWSER